MTDRVCGEPAQIDAAWMTEALEEGGVARGATVTDLELVGLIGTGQTGCNARYHLTWDRPEGRPASVVGKFPSQDPSARAAAFATGTYQTEFEFYTALRPTLDVRAPHCWVARFDAAAQAFVLIMEDLSRSRQGDQIEGLSVDEAALAVEQAVALHAPRWGDPALTDFAGHRPKGEEAAMGLGVMYTMTMEPFLDRLGAGLDHDVVRLVRDLQPHVAAWATASDTPRTAVHIDFRPDNFMFGTTADAPPLAVVDWQTVTDGNAMVDLAYLFGGCFEPSQRAGVERALLDEYLTRLTKAGVSYDADTMWRDYRLGAIWGVVMTVIATILAAETERGNAMLTVMGQRHGRHALDLESVDLLR